MSINKVIMAGRITRDIELKEPAAGLKAARITIATNHKSKKKDGTEVNDVCYIDSTLWGNEAISASKFLKKGSAVAIEGRLKLEKWMDKATNTERTKHVIAVDNVMYLEKISQFPEDKSASQKVEINMQKNVIPDLIASDDFEELPF